MTDFVAIRLSRAAAIVLRSWLERVPSTAVPVTHASERQALADLLNDLESSIDEPTVEALNSARTVLLRDAGDWVNDGPTYITPTEG